MSTIRFIADLHLYDLYSLDWRTMSLDEYASTLQTHWNNITAVDDTVIIVGDIGHFCTKTVNLLKSLNGKKILVLGNHDTEWGNNVYTCGVFSGVHQQIVRSDFIAEHIPDETTLKGTYYIHGHHHLYTPYPMRQALKLYAKDVMRLNCASDLIGHTPRTLHELILQKELLLDNMEQLQLI